MMNTPEDSGRFTDLMRKIVENPKSASHGPVASSLLGLSGPARKGDGREAIAARLKAGPPVFASVLRRVTAANLTFA